MKTVVLDRFMQILQSVVLDFFLCYLCKNLFQIMLWKWYCKRKLYCCIFANCHFGPFPENYANLCSSSFYKFLFGSTFAQLVIRGCQVQEYSMLSKIMRVVRSCLRLGWSKQQRDGEGSRLSREHYIWFVTISLEVAGLGWIGNVARQARSMLPPYSRLAEASKQI